jgi:hypothetical protein
MSARPTIRHSLYEPRTLETHERSCEKGARGETCSEFPRHPRRGGGPRGVCIFTSARVEGLAGGGILKLNVNITRVTRNRGIRAKTNCATRPPARADEDAALPSCVSHAGSKKQEGWSWVGRGGGGKGGRGEGGKDGAAAVFLISFAFLCAPRAPKGLVGNFSGNQTHARPDLIPYGQNQIRRTMGHPSACCLNLSILIPI